LVAATVIGYVVSGDLPDRQTVIGALVIVAATVSLGWSERRASSPAKKSLH
jgi:protein-arginine kinase